ncbi:NADH-quinone oxidoreductase subunit J family protein [Maridesulfovibrio hydrothermalis]|uniref:NADH-quinone oxidoreductase subunit J n=1 Tax=Maridesulfovibrio hydrothermalis AM13 = DSM 14728 TaxID=1121451 RepID=L0RFS3_9BACT|nr:NADH-quinone oxidoreductase subunit J [Maridesulfovibrio hydrothermalis]CCO25050.1 NADH-ubiquinone/plastoquinone oxidoreductase chain 6 [Maridesulfovibrio hydrothermalis AM13 = DSM 14728]
MMELLAKIAFAVYTLLILSGGCIAVGAHSLIRAMVGLISSLLGVAGMYMLMAAPFMAFMQILIYVGAVCVLIFFAIMLSRADEHGVESGSKRPGKAALSALTFITPTFVIGYMLVKFQPESINIPIEIPLAAVGKGLLEDYPIAFELISVVLLAAMAGAVLLAYEPKGRKGGKV